MRRVVEADDVIAVQLVLVRQLVATQRRRPKNAEVSHRSLATFSNALAHLTTRRQRSLFFILDGRFDADWQESGADHETKFGRTAVLNERNVRADFEAGFLKSAVSKAIGKKGSIVADARAGVDVRLEASRFAHPHRHGLKRFGMTKEGGKRRD